MLGEIELPRDEGQASVHRPGQPGAGHRRAPARHPDHRPAEGLAVFALTIYGLDAGYEQAMFPRAAEAAGEDIYGIMLGDDAPHSWIAMMIDDEQPA
jgi:hypothetical protein